MVLESLKDGINFWSEVLLLVLYIMFKFKPDKTITHEKSTLIFLFIF